MSRGILLVSCPDKPGLVSAFANFIHHNNGNFYSSDNHTDHEQGQFLSRLEWDMDGFAIKKADIETEFAKIATPLGATWEFKLSDDIPKIAIWVSTQEHCLYDIILRHKAGEFHGQIPLIVSNHEKLKHVAEHFEIDYYHLPVTSETKAAQEKRQLELLSEYNIDLVILAKYMQVLTPEFLAKAPTTINIHHSFLPAFRGSNPYLQAYERGVKVIGATAHYVNEELDGGPIISQDVVDVTHRQTVADFKRDGKDIERIVLGRAVRWHLQNKVLSYSNRTVVFD